MLPSVKEILHNHSARKKESMVINRTIYETYKPVGGMTRPREFRPKKLALSCRQKHHSSNGINSFGHHRFGSVGADTSMEGKQSIRMVENPSDSNMTASFG